MRSFLAAVLLAAAVLARAQESPPPDRGPDTPPVRPAQTGAGQADAVRGAPPGSQIADITFADGTIEGTRVDAEQVVFRLGEYELTGGRLTGDTEGELTFTGDPVLIYRGQVVAGDAIRFTPKTRAYRVDNLRTALTPDFLRGRLRGDLFLRGGGIAGQPREPVIGSDTAATTCDLGAPHYQIQAREIEVEPGESVTMRRAAFVVGGRRILTLPVFRIPLDRQAPRTSYTPEVGRSLEEGWYAKSSFNYSAGRRFPGRYRVDAMERRGLGLGVEQAWRALKASGSATLYGVTGSGTQRDMSGALQHRQSIGGGQAFSLDGSYRRNSYLTLPETTSNSARLAYSLSTPGVTGNVSLGRQSTTTSTYSSNSLTAALSQAFRFGSNGSSSLNLDYSKYTSGSASSTSVTQQLSARYSADYRSDHYTLQLTANRNVPIGTSTNESYFGGAEKLPEVTLSNYRFTNGLLSRLPANFTVSAGKYTEASGYQATAARISTERVVAGFDVMSVRRALSPTTDLSVAGGFQQFFYAEGAAQYIVRNSATLTQRIGKRGGINLNYSYQQPQGGTPFRFDQQNKYHALNADVGFLNDSRLQLTARVGYDFASSNYLGTSTPWQTLSANLLVRPTNWLRMRNLVSYDPNTGQMTSATADLRIRGRSDMALDVVSRYDPRTHKFGQVNTYLNLPVGPQWRVIALAQYNGYLSRFESRNLQIVRDLHCLEAALTYTENPFGWRAERSIMFQLRLKAFPSFQRFGTGAYGQAIDTSVGEMY